ncbi:MAG: hypothetical protein H0X45_04215 [Planctomycetes bacterium]|nr:hypothetical protein [Planctomycetota bacterium]
MRGPRTLWSCLLIAAFVLSSIVAVSIATMPQHVAPIIGRILHVREQLQAWWTDRWGYHNDANARGAALNC